MKKLLVFFLFIYSLSYASGRLSKSIDKYVSTYVKTGDFSGCILITKKDSIIYNNCFGKSNYSFDLGNNQQTKFKIGSVSKQFTAAAILVLEQEGILNTKDTLSKYFPDYPITGRITIEHLLTHTSGLTDIFNLPNFNKLSCENILISDLSRMVLESNLDFEPGSQYQYSNGGFAVLAQIIEQVSGKSYGEYLKDNIFTPLRLNSTGHNKSGIVVENLSIGYDPLGYNDVKITSFLDNELLKGSGSLFSTINDLNIWINSIKNRDFLSEKSYDKFLNNYGSNYGYGISVYKSFGNSVFGHDGRINGYIADYLHYEEDDISIIILGNIQTGVSDFFRRDLAAIIFNKEYISRAKSIPPISKSLIDPSILVGVYAFSPNFKVYVDFFEGTIQARANEGGYSELIPLEDGRYFSRTLYSYIQFVSDENKKITKMIWTNNDGNSFEGIREVN